MAYYSHPLFTPATGSRHPAYHFGPTGPSPSHQQPFHHQSYSAPSLDEEERLAYAHLAAIQRRREAEAASIQREAAARYEAQQQREAAIAQHLAAERRREAAIRHAMAVEERKRQIAIAIEERKRHVAAQIAKQKEEQALRAAAVAHARQQQIEEHRRRYVRAVELARAEKEQRYLEHVLAKRNACARRCAAKRQEQELEQVENAKEEKEVDGLEALNSLFGSLFGVTFTDDNVGDKKDETLAASPAAPQSEPVKPSETTTAAPAPETTKPEVDTKQPESAFPEAINDLVSHFLGLRVEPTSESSTASASSNKVPEGLNELLGQFGLVFEPTAVKEKAQDEAVVATKEEVADPEVPLPTSLPAPATSSTSASTPAPAAASSSSSSSRTAESVKNDTPLTAFLDSAAHLPPFVRDILGNVELAFKEERHRQKEQSQPATESPKVEGKGKGVAEGEKKASPSAASAPSPAPGPESVPSPVDAAPSSTSSIAQLDAIASELDLATASFTFPSTLSFSATSTSPSLLFNRTNSPYHAQTNKLLQLLLSADGVSTNGDKSVRQRRKEVVRQVEAEIEKLESKRDEMWHEVQEKRERGEEVEGDVEDERSWSGSETASVASKSRAASVVDESEERETLDVDEVQGFEVPKEVEHVEDVKVADGQQTPSSVLVEESKSFADVAKTALTSTEAGTANVEEVKDKQDGDQKSKVEEAKDEGFELL